MFHLMLGPAEASTPVLKLHGKTGNRAVAFEIDLGGPVTFTCETDMSSEYVFYFRGNEVQRGASNTYVVKAQRNSIKGIFKCFANNEYSNEITVSRLLSEYMLCI